MKCMNMFIRFLIQIKRYTFVSQSNANMNKLILLSVFIFVATISFSSGINKPVSSQYGFIENKGQIIDQNNQLNPSVLYLYNGNGLHVQLKQSGFSYEVIKTESKPKAKTGNEINVPSKFAKDTLDYTLYFHRIDISFVGSNQNAKITASDVATDYINYYTTGTSEAGVINVHHYKKVLYQNIYDNIDVEFIISTPPKSPQGGLAQRDGTPLSFGECRGEVFKYNFIVHPNGNVNDIQLKFAGANNTSLTNEGHITIETACGNIDESIPMSFQLCENNKQQTIAANFKQQTSNTFGISVGNYDPIKTLIIDPTPFSTYFGGSGNEAGEGIGTDSSGNIIISGSTTSTSAIATSGAYQTSYGGTQNGFIAKFNSSGSRQWSTYFGGTGSDDCRWLAIDASSNILLTGYTTSTTGIATTGAYQTAHGGGTYDGFISKFNPSGTRQWSTYYGGTSFDRGAAIAVDLNGNILVVGLTTSSTGISTSGSFQSVYTSGNYDAFVVKFNTSGVRQWATYFGGSGSDYGYGITTDTSNNIIAVGQTTSISGIATTGAYDTLLNGSVSTSYMDAFIVKFNSAGSRLWSTYYGGNMDDADAKVATDLSGNIFISGQTNSYADLATSGAYQTSLGGNWDVFIAKFNSNDSIQWSTYYGGTAGENGNSLTTDISGNVIIVGLSASSNAIASSGAYQTSNGGTYDAIVAKFNTAGSKVWGTYFGGTSYEYGYGITTNSLGSIYIVGKTSSSSSIATSGAYQTTLGGGYDAFIAAFTNAGGLPVQLTSFDVKLVNNKNVLCTWETASQVNNDYFEIEKSINNINWNAIGKVKGNGTTNSVSNYQFKDVSTALDMTTTKPSTTLYYRLQQVDFDGKSSFSEVKVVSLNNDENNYNIYPNPNAGAFSINFNNIEGEKQIAIYNIQGKLVGSCNTSENVFEVKELLAKGMYFIKVETNIGFFNSKFVVE